MSPAASTPLAEQIAARIARDGPMPVRAFMAACLSDPESGYYRRQPAIGAAADFITAPEISQVFGELVAVWAILVWEAMGAPDRVALVELGPGRATLMKDVLRSARTVPAFEAALTVHLVDSNATLRGIQRETLQETRCPIVQHYDVDAALFSDATHAPTIVIANEFLDALPIDQLVRCGAGWRTRTVGVDAAGNLQWQLGSEAPSDHHPPAGLAAGAAEGAIYETRHDAVAPLIAALAARSRSGPLAALLIDYGSPEPRLGSTLAAIRRHRPVTPFDAPGESDLSADVDFAALSAAARSAGLAVDGPVTQTAFLFGLGLAERTQRLLAAATPRERTAIELGVHRLVAPDAMGSRFQACVLRGAGVMPTPPFQQPRRTRSGD